MGGPIKVLRARVSADEIGRSYLKAELARLLSRCPPHAIDAGIDGLPAADSTRLLVALSHHYRDNAVYDYVLNEGYDWSEEQWSIEDTRLERVDDRINPLL